MPSFRLVVYSEHTGGIAVELEEVRALEVQLLLFLVKHKLLDTAVGPDAQKDRIHGGVVLWLDITGGEVSVLSDNHLAVILRHLHQRIAHFLGPDVHCGLDVLA
ncbi:hypothetical protein OGATHE_005648 [Ogataea polymorpha]|uniref:Uncharacterized protein n=1 Tax=Ogataea polymorpha TaxID=460523 RepID=A0A9P8NSE6_9ASCO|nr:hypothetical protein OGATHE_005648 [Ogataea polymorpha]